MGSALREGMQLETICDMKNIESYCSQISVNAEKGGVQRREFVMVGKIFKLYSISFLSILLGRSNVGKSSLINAMVEANIAKTSNYPVCKKIININNFFCFPTTFLGKN